MIQMPIASRVERFEPGAHCVEEVGRRFAEAEADDFVGAQRDQLSLLV